MGVFNVCGEKRVWFWLERDGHGTVHPWERWPDSEAKPFGKIGVSSNERSKMSNESVPSIPLPSLVESAEVRHLHVLSKGIQRKKKKSLFIDPLSRFTKHLSCRPACTERKTSTLSCPPRRRRRKIPPSTPSRYEATSRRKY